jgi:hypothetical protein
VGIRDLVVSTADGPAFAVLAEPLGMPPPAFPDQTCYIVGSKAGAAPWAQARDGYAFQRLALSADGSFLAAGLHPKPKDRWGPFGGNLVCCLSATDGRALGTAAMGAPSMRLTSLQFSPSGAFLQCGHGGGVSIYSVPRLEARAIIRGRINDSAFSDDGRYAAMVDGGTIEVIELRTKQVFLRVRCQYPVTTPTFASQSGMVISHPAFSSDGSILAFCALAGDGQVVEAWDVLRGERVAKLAGLLSPVNCIFVPNSNVLAIVEGGAHIVLFSVPSCRQLAAINHSPATALVVCREGRRLAVTGGDSVVVWALDRAKLGTNGTGRARAGPAASPTAQAVFARWYESLASSDASEGREAMLRLCGTADETTAFLATRMRPVTVDLVEITRMLHDLASDKLATRQAACTALERVAMAAPGQLREAAKSATSVEVRLNLNRIIANSQEYCIRDTGCIQALRAIQCLEKIGSVKSRVLLDRLSKGAPDSPITQDAKAALSRLTDWVQAD